MKKTNKKSPKSSQDSKKIEEKLLKELGLDEPPTRHENDEEPFENTAYSIAEFSYRNGHTIKFSYDEVSNDFGILQEGGVNESTPVIFDEFNSILDAYLSVAPENLSVPEEVFQEKTIGNDYREKIKDRSIATSCIIADNFANAPTAAAGQSCYSNYYSWWDYRESAQPGMFPKTFYASSFTVKKQRYAQSYVFNCAPSNYPSWIWARHRIYYKTIWGYYKKHFDDKVKPSKWQAKTKAL